MNTGDLVHLAVERDAAGNVTVVEDEHGSAVIFYVESTDGQNAVIRYTDDEVELTRPVADLIPAT